MTESNIKLGSDLARIDAYVSQPREYDDLPELTDARLANAVERLNGVVVLPAPRQSRTEVTLQLVLKNNNDVRFCYSSAKQS